MEQYGNHNVTVYQWLYVILFLLFLSKAQASEDTSPVNITFIENAILKGAVCLDGSPGGYYFARGFDNGVNNWIIFLPGGGWCNNVSSCLDKPKLGLGSTAGAKAKTLVTILSANKDTNPDFYNWNNVSIVYCDGASFMADGEDVDPETNLHLRGRRIFSSIVEELITTQGMDRATNALLAGNSAGGLATILNCDRFRSYLPTASVKCFSDSGFFIQAKDISGATFRQDNYAQVVEYHELARFLPESCTSKMAPGLCLFSENVVGDVQTPLFLLNSDFDQYQISKTVKPNPPDEQGWENCTNKFDTDLHNCTSSQIKLIKDFQMAFLKTLEGLDDNPSRGLFINSCFIHDFIYSNWQGPPTLQNMTVAQALGNWYLERSDIKSIDFQHPYPLNCTASQKLGACMDHIS